MIWEMWSALLVTRNPWCESMLGAVDDDGVARYGSGRITNVLWVAHQVCASVMTSSVRWVIWSIPCAGIVGSLGSMPPGGTIAWLPTVSATAGVEIPTASVGGVIPTVPSMGGTEAMCAAVPRVPSSGIGNGLIPVPEKIAKRILKLDFVDMKELMPESWIEEEDEGRNVLKLPKRRAAPLSILQWVQCFSRMVGVLAAQYPGMVPELMGYLIVIVKCVRDFEGQACAQYDRAFRQRMAAAKDWRWSNVNTTLFNLCFAGKARRNVACKFCTSDEHALENCLDNPLRVGLQWQNNWQPRGGQEGQGEENMFFLQPVGGLYV